MPVSNTASGLTTSITTCTPFLLVRCIHLHNLQAADLKNVCNPVYAIFGGSRPGWKNFHQSFSSTLLEPWRLIDEMTTTFKKYRLVSWTSSCPFLVMKGCFSSQSLGYDKIAVYAVCLTFKFPSFYRSTLHCAPICLPRCVTGVTSAYACGELIGETVANFSNGLLCLKPEPGLW